MADIKRITVPVAGGGTATYNIKDEWARQAIAEIQSRGIKFTIGWDGKSTPDISKIPAGVVVVWQDTEYTGNMAPSTTDPSTGVKTPVADIILVYSDAGTSKDVFDEYAAINAGTSSDPDYIWERIGSTDIDIGDLGDLAYADTATGSGTVSTADSATFTGTSFSSTGSFTPAGSIAVTLKQTSTSAGLTTSDYTPAGTVSVGLKQTSTSASLTKGDYTPEGTVSTPTITVTPSTTTVKVRDTAGSVTAGTAASFTQGSDTFTAATHGTDQYTSASWSASVAEGSETLTISFTPGSFSSGAFNGGSFSQGSDTFSANTPTSVTLDTFKDQTVATGITSATSSQLTFTGTKETGLKVTGVSYDKASVDSATFTGTTADDIIVTGVSYDKATVQSQTFTGTAGNVSVSGTPTGNIALTKTDKTVTVTVHADE